MKIPSYIQGYAFSSDYETTMNARSGRSGELKAIPITVVSRSSKFGHNHTVITLKLSGNKTTLRELSALDLVLLCDTTATFGATVEKYEITGTPEQAILSTEVYVHGDD